MTRFRWIKNISLDKKRKIYAMKIVWTFIKSEMDFDYL